MHFDSTPPDAIGRHGLCGYVICETTHAEADVTCKLCRRHLKAEREAIPDYVDERWFIEKTRKPLPMSNMTRADAQLWRYVVEGMARIVSGEDHRVARPTGPRAPFVSLGHALAAYIHTRVHGYSGRSVADPDRLQRWAGLLGSPSTTRVTPTEVAEADRSATIESVARRTSAGLASEEWPARRIMEAVLRRYVARQRPTLIAEDMGATGKAIGRITRQWESAAWEEMVRIGLIEDARGCVQGEDEMRFNDCDLEGWDEIAEFVDCDPRTCRRYAEKHAMPVYQNAVTKRVQAKSAELRTWMAAQRLER